MIPKNPYLFVVGCPRSGTTLMRRMLDAHPELAVANDTHFIPEAIKDVPEDSDPLLTPEVIERVRQCRFFRWFGLPDAAVDQAAAQAHTYAEFVSALYVTYGLMHGKPLAGEKTPDYCRHLPRLHRLFPWVRTIHIIRDGRDVALSTMDWAHETRGPGRFALWQEHPVAVCALWWRWMVRAGRRDGAALGPSRYLEVRYNDVVEQSEETLRGVTSFIQLPFAPEMLTYYVGKVRRRPGLSAKESWQPPTSGIRNWRKRMRRKDVALFEAIAGDLLSELGYERRVERIPPDIAAVAKRCERWWDAEMAWRRERALWEQERVKAKRCTSSTPVRTNPRPVFILGNAKSGTTAIAALLAQATGRSVTLDLPIDDSRGIYQDIRRGVVPIERLLEEEPHAFAQEIIKEPHLTVFYEDLKRAIPDAKFAFIIRDPRENIRSVLNRLAIPGDLDQLSSAHMGEVVRSWPLVLNGQWLGLDGENYIEMLAARWVYLAKIYLTHARQVVLIRYEDFLSDKVGAITRLAHHLGLQPVHDISDKLDVQYQPRGNHRVTWDEFFGPVNRQRIESICGDAMRRLGYTTSGIPPIQPVPAKSFGIARLRKAMGSVLSRD